MSYVEIMDSIRIGAINCVGIVTSVWIANYVGNIE